MHYKKQHKLISPLLVAVISIPTLILAASKVAKEGFVMQSFLTLDNILATLLVIAITLFIYFMRIDIDVSAEGVAYRMFPWHFKMKDLAWQEVESAKLVQFSPFSQFWGVGLRYNKDIGTAYIVGGTIGLYLHTKQGKRLLLEISDVEEFKRFIHRENMNWIETEIIKLK